MDNNVIANLKTLSIDMINRAKSGHPGIALSAAPIIYTLYANHININPKDTKWINRDRFVLSAGHASSLLYACLYMADYLTLEDLKKFRQINSLTPGHPEYGKTKGVDMTTGPLGQGLASAVGMAIGEKHLQEKFKNLIDYNIYVLCGDGDLMEGVSYEAASLAGTLKLNNLIVLYDSNNMTLDGSTEGVFTEDVRERFDAMGWNTILVRDGNKISEIDRAINKAKKSELPTLIEIKTILGQGSLLENNNLVHGKPLTKEDIDQLKKKLNISNEPFYVNKKAINYFRKKLNDRSQAKYQTWQIEYNHYMKNHDEDQLLKFYNKIIEFKSNGRPFIKVEREATRDSNSKVMNFLASKTDLLFGGSADLGSCCKTNIQNQKDFTKGNYNGVNINFGVREHAMGAIINGLALTGYLPYGSTFLTFSDYLKPAIRLSCLMNLPVTYIFTHDSINVGEDGPTHQPIEQITSLRATPNLNVYRPADFNEVFGVWNAIITLKKPSAIILSRSETKNLNCTSPLKVLHGAYIVKDATEIDAILIATGTELNTCLEIANELKEYNIRVVSMPCVELFLSMPKKYRYKILPVGTKTFFIEASNGSELRKFVTNEKYLITLEDFGCSGKPEDVLKQMNFSKEQIKERIKQLL